ncbi:MAG TPA: DMT family transporter [Acidimicrobiales bacterium]
MASRSSSSLAALALAGIATTWGLIGLIVRQIDLSAVAIVAGRCWLGAVGIGLGLLVVCWRTGARPPRPTRPVLTAVCGAVLAIHWLLLVAAQQQAPLGTVMLLMYLSPVLVAVLAPRVLGETVAPTTKVALALALVGLALLARPEPGDLRGVLLAIAAGVAFAAWTLLSKLVVADIGGFWLGFSNLAIAGLVLAPWALRADWSDVRQSWSWLLVLGLGMTALLGPLYLVVLDHLPASTASVLLYLEPLSALLLAWAFLRETPTATTLVGGSLIVAGGIIVLRKTTTVADTEALSHVPG